jgi:hypothetical protein
VRNLRTWLAMEREKAQGEEPRGRKYQCVSTGADCSVVAMKRGNGRGAKGAGHSRRDRRVNWKQEELTGFGGRRQPLSGGTSRISREAYVRFCERLGVKFPGPTRRKLLLFSECCGFSGKRGARFLHGFDLFAGRSQHIYRDNQRTQLSNE